jgi:hypothetical protein
MVPFLSPFAVELRSKYVAIVLNQPFWLPEA